MVNFQLLLKPSGFSRWSFSVSFATVGGYYCLDAAIDDVGKVIVVWECEVADGFSGIRARCADGASVWTDEVIVSGAGDACLPAVAMNGDGSAVVAWASSEADPALDICARWYDAGSDTWAPAIFVVNTVTDGYQSFPAVAMDGTGNALFAWTSDDSVRARLVRRIVGPHTIDAGQGMVSSVDFGNVPPGNLSGNVWEDKDGNGQFEAGIDGPAPAGWTVFLDTDGDGTLDSGEQACTTGVPNLPGNG